MFRRGRGRMIGHVWPPLRPWAKSPLEARGRQDIQRANRLMEIGDFTNAATLYENLARKVHDFNRPRQAGHLYVQAARARVLAGQIKPGLDTLKHGLTIFAQAGLWGVFEAIGSRAIGELGQLGQPQAAQDLADWLDTKRSNRTMQDITPTIPVSSPRSLPLKCPSCGATVRPDEVEWVDEDHAACDYCGSVMAAT
jgi:hypothetical protein